MTELDTTREEYHDKLVNKTETTLKKYGFQTQTKINIPSPIFPFPCFEEGTEIDIYCHSRPFAKEVVEGTKPTDILASDFIVECKTGRNLNETDKKKILSQAKYFPVYIAIPDDLSAENNVVSFLKENRIGLMVVDEEGHIKILLPAYAKFIVGDSLEASIKLDKHEIFEIFKYRTGQEQIVCMPFGLRLENRNNSKTTWQHNFIKQPNTMKEILGMRNKFISIFEKDGCDTAESWAIFSGIETKRNTFQGFNIHGLIFAFEKINKNRNHEKKSKEDGITLLDKSDADLTSSWDNDDFVFCVSAVEDGTESALLYLTGNVIYTTRGYHLRFITASILSDAQITKKTIMPDGDNWIRRTKEIDIEIKGMNTRKMILEDGVSPVQALIRNYEAKKDAYTIRSDEPGYYFYSGQKGRFVVSIWDYANGKTLDRKQIRIESIPGNSVVFNYIIDGITLQAPIGYREELI